MNVISQSKLKYTTERVNKKRISCLTFKLKLWLVFPEGLEAGLTGRPHAVAGSLDRLPADNLLAGGKTSIQPIGHKTTQKRKTKSSYCLRGGPTTIIIYTKGSWKG
jgi:hypothetical protein